MMLGDYCIMHVRHSAGGRTDPGGGGLPPFMVSIDKLQLQVLRMGPRIIRCDLSIEMTKTGRSGYGQMRACC
jgi:hypothetical protein